jgi:hypothetical protein
MDMIVLQNKNPFFSYLIVIGGKGGFYIICKEYQYWKKNHIGL